MRTKNAFSKRQVDVLLTRSIVSEAKRDSIRREFMYFGEIYYKSLCGLKDQALRQNLRASKRRTVLRLMELSNGEQGKLYSIALDMKLSNSNKQDTSGPLMVACAAASPFLFSAFASLSHSGLSILKQIPVGTI